MMASKIWIKVVLDSYFDPEGTVDALIASLQSIKETHPDHKDFVIERKYNGYDEKDSYELMASRLETDKEFEKRIKALQKQKEKAAKEKADQEEAELKLYEKLSKKYGKVS